MGERSEINRELQYLTLNSNGRERGFFTVLLDVPFLSPVYYYFKTTQSFNTCFDRLCFWGILKYFLTYFGVSSSPTGSGE